MQKAERAKQRAEKKAAEGKEQLGGTSPEKSGQEVIPGAASPEKSRAEPRGRPAIPNAVRHQVWLRDLGQCTWRYPNGERCAEKKMLELDHNLMFCRGGNHTADNLTLRCRYHNQISAEDLLGREFMERRRKARFHL